MMESGIDIAQHPEHKLWIPEMIFGYLMTSTINKNQEKKSLVVKMDLESS